MEYTAVQGMSQSRRARTQGNRSEFFGLVQNRVVWIYRLNANSESLSQPFFS